MIEGSISFQQKMRCKITGTQLYQKVGRRNRRGYRRIKEKYNQAVNALTKR